ncbi:YaiO family outer membrane beta-barrel protein [Caulobacter sp. 602-2]|uniref:YaiO family outer membrane beta-barrel protein n=1 Tax=Caulobacter sp. 602-2 TaxID=2710887 RepID=A0A6G4QSJ0_9CAUL|nr:YaiO family outer membrane beta-barrel protein [Caulobacter sp. 602-2]NGM48294.1 YaiO family outer membrane beta-barrel protein [Caulobacter sp. 602-2]
MIETAAVQAPETADPAYAAAVQARQAGRTAEAIAAFDLLSKQRPKDPDVWLNLGLSRMAAQRYAEADRAFETTLTLAPDYRDARIAYARSALFSGRPELARRRLAPLLATAPNDAEARNLEQQIAATQAMPGEPTWRLDLAYARSELTKDLGHWSAATLALSKRLDPATTVGGSIEHTERFGVSDTYAEALVARRFGQRLDAFLAVGGAPDADYRPELSIRVGGSAALRDTGPWRARLGLDAVWSRYAVGEVKSLQPYLTLAAGPASLTVRSINTEDERGKHQSGYTLNGEWAASERLRLRLGYADAPESADGATVPVEAISGGIAYDLTSRWTVQVVGAHEKRTAYDRDEVGVAVTRRF